MPPRVTANVNEPGWFLPMINVGTPIQDGVARGTVRAAAIRTPTVNRPCTFLIYTRLTQLVLRSPGSPAVLCLIEVLRINRAQPFLWRIQNSSTTSLCGCDSCVHSTDPHRSYVLLQPQ